MNKTIQSRSWLQFLFAVIIFAAVLGVAYIYQDKLKEAVLTPILYLMWVGDLIIKSFSQRCIWMLALAITLVVSLSFSRRNANSFDVSQKKVSRRSPPNGRIHFWRSRIRGDKSSIFGRSFRHSEMRGLAIQALAYRENSNVEEIKEQLRYEQISVPAELSYIFEVDDQQNESNQSTGYFLRLRQMFEMVAKRFVDPTFLPDPKLEEAADYLENLLEVDNGSRNQ
ncbi:hypothetical protein ACFLXI_00575 [Chloroflexota bacterium]